MADKSSYKATIQKQTLKGHRKAVLCVAHSSDRIPYTCNPRKRSGTHNQNGTSNDNSERDQQQSRHGHRHRPSLLLSGSEDGTARLWDLRMRKTAFCMLIPRESDGDSLPEVTSVAFHPSGDFNIPSEEEEKRNSGMLLDGTCDCTVFASTSNKIYGYDLRYHSIAATDHFVDGSNDSESSLKNIVNPILKKPHFDLSPLFHCTDEINQMSFSFPKHNDKSGKLYMSTADDSGEVHICEEISHKYQSPTSGQTMSDATTITPTTIQTQHKTLFHADPESFAITSCSVFRPRANDTYLASGGTDCLIKYWDVSKPRRPVSTIQIKPLQSENTTQLCNPPFIHSLSWSPSGRLLSAGVGDGSCVILRAEGRRLVEAGRLGWDEGGHGSAVAAVCFPGFGLRDSVTSSLNMSSKALANAPLEDRLMISAGNDGHIIFWDLGRDIVGKDALDPVLYLGGCLKPLEDSSADDTTANNKSDSINNNEAAGVERKDGIEDLDNLQISSEKEKGKTKKKGKGGKGKRAVKDISVPASNETIASIDIPEDLLPSPPKVLFKIAHKQKPNWIACSHSSEAVLPSTVFVADTTNDISAYIIPA